MNILDEIVIAKKVEVASHKESQPLQRLEASSLFMRNTYSLKHALANADGCGLIAEFKRKSPSKGIINSSSPIIDTTKSYVAAGAHALSVLTNETFFGGNNEDLLNARTHNDCPILRKDFIIDEYQIIQSKAIGADAILLIAAILTKDQVKSFTTLAHSLGMEVLLEIHNAKELDVANPEMDVIGVNNRNLKTFKTDINISLELSALIGSDFIKISESGIASAETAFSLRQNGFDGFLIGEQFMSHNDPGAACASFLKTLKHKIYAS